MQENETLNNDIKERFSIFIHQSVIELVKNNYAEEFKCASDYVEHAIKFYFEYSHLKHSTDLVAQILTSTLKDIIRESDNKIGRMMFKMAVEMSIMMNVVASGYNIREEEIDRIRGICANEVKKMNGSISFEDAVRWQS